MQRGWRRRPCRANESTELLVSATVRFGQVSSFLILGLELYASALQSYQDKAT
ncbi:hypothetical protein D3C77_74600 [compost metagenome]